MSDLEHLGIEVAAVLLVGALLVGLAETPLYPLAIGILVVALFYVLTSSGGSTAVASLNSLIGRLGNG